MRPLVPILVIVASLIAVTIGAGQIKPSRNVTLAIAPQYKLIAGGAFSARFDPKSGATQILEAVSAPGSVKYQWKTVGEPAPLSATATSYEVVATGSGLTRMSSAGDSWFSYSASGVLKWQLIH